MKHSGRAFQAALKIIFWTLVALITFIVLGFIALLILIPAYAFSFMLIGVWVVFSLFTLYFFRDPTPRVPTGPGLIVSPAHGKVDIIDQVDEAQFMGGRCQRISIFLSVFNVHVQNAPVSGKADYYRYNTGQFLSALKTESAEQNENLLLGFTASEHGDKIGLRLIAGVIARRIVPYVKLGDEVMRGERISLIQFGSRTDLYLPLTAKITIKLEDKVVGGQTVMATFE
ncbi:MAG TPA: phosphatidylserine decarboxylase [Verrucomicrobiae bacterium]|nr:phosphatidylserine decarboxylase [Verrucomicrobiae bacterium]